MGLKANLKVVINKAIKDVQDQPLFPDAQHNTLSNNHPDGEVTYFGNEIYNLLCEIPKRSGMGNAWINSKTPKVTGDISLNYYLGLSNNKLYKFESDDDFLQFAKEDFTTFLRDYFAWTKFRGKLPRQNIIDEVNERSFYDAILVEDKEGVISTINSLIYLKNPGRKEIAIILCAMEKEGVIVIDNIQQIANMWFSTFGYRKKLKSLSNGLFEYLAGDRKIFCIKNKSKIDIYRMKFE